MVDCAKFRDDGDAVVLPAGLAKSGHAEQQKGASYLSREALVGKLSHGKAREVADGILTSLFFELSEPLGWHSFGS